MAKRFIATEIWGEDWFLDMPNEYKLFWFYILGNCDHAGLFKVNLTPFRGLLGVKVTPHDALAYFNAEKIRIREISKSLWFVEDFFVFQYGTTFNINNKVHESIGKLYNRHNINIKEIRGLRDLKEGVKDKDKEKKGGMGENKKLKGEDFDETRENVLFPDGTIQQLGIQQRELAKTGKLKPSSVLQGSTY
jgi:hypothetical protein